MHEKNISYSEKKIVSEQNSEFIQTPKQIF